METTTLIARKHRRTWGVVSEKTKMTCVCVRVTFYDNSVQRSAKQECHTERKISGERNSQQVLGSLSNKDF